MMQQRLSRMDFTTFNKLDPEKLQSLEELLSDDIPRIMKLIPEEQNRIGTEAVCIAQVSDKPSPFAVTEVSQSLKIKAEWLVAPDVADYREDFEALGPIDGKLTGQQARQ